MDARAAVCSLVALALTAACSGDSGSSDTRKALERGFERAAQDQGVVALPELVPADWDEVAFVCPYEDNDELTRRLGFRWDDFPGRLDDESDALFVFVRADRVVTWARLARRVGDPCAGAGSQIEPVRRDAATFRVEKTTRTAGGDDFYSLRPAQG